MIYINSKRVFLGMRFRSNTYTRKQNNGSVGCGGTAAETIKTENDAYLLVTCYCKYTAVEGNIYQTKRNTKKRTVVLRTKTMYARRARRGRGSTRCCLGGTIRVHRRAVLERRKCYSRREHIKHPSRVSCPAVPSVTD